MRRVGPHYVTLIVRALRSINMVRWLKTKAKWFDDFIQTQNKRVIGYSVAVTAASTTVALALHLLEKVIEICKWFIKLF